MLPAKTALLSIESILEKAHLNDGYTVADFGCGRSLILIQALLHIIGRNGYVYGIDILPEIIESVSSDLRHHKHSNAEALRGNLEKENGIPLPDNILDAGFLINTLHQSGNSLSMIREASRLIKPGGRLVVVDWDSKPSPIGPSLEARLNKDQTIEILEANKLEALDHFEAGPYHYGIAALVN